MICTSTKGLFVTRPGLGQRNILRLRAEHIQIPEPSVLLGGDVCVKRAAFWNSFTLRQAPFRPSAGPPWATHFPSLGLSFQLSQFSKGIVSSALPIPGVLRGPQAAAARDTNPKCHSHSNRSDGTSPCGSPGSAGGFLCRVNTLTAALGDVPLIIPV